MSSLPMPLDSDWLRARAAATPHKRALLLDNEALSWGALDQLVDATCRWLQARPLPTARRLAVRLSNDLSGVRLIFAALRLRLTLVPLNRRLTETEISWQLAQLGIPQVEMLSGPLEFEPGGTPHASWEAAAPAPDDLPQGILFTSGTSGRPKPVPLSAANHFYGALASAYRLGVQPDDVWLSVLPLYHVGGLAVVLRSCLYGTAVDLHPRWELEAVQAALTHKPITLISLVPTLLHRLLESGTLWPDSLRCVLIGGAALTPELHARASAAGLPIATTYGMTEAASQIATLPPAEAAAKPESVGRPLLFTQLEIRDADGAPQPAHTPGEIWVSGPTLTSGYLDQPQANAQRFRDGWFATGDLGTLDAAGDLFVLQRRSDLIISGGENVYPAEVERVLRAHPGVAEACVVGIADVEWGERVAAAVELTADVRLAEKELLSFSRTRLAGYKQPRLLRILSALPRTASGKIARREVQAILSEASAKA